MKIKHLKFLQNYLVSLQFFPAFLYFSIFMLVSYRTFGFENILFYVSFFVLLPALFWGFLDTGRALVSISLMALIVIHFLLGGKFAFLLFLILPFVFVNLRDWGLGAIIIMILLNISIFLYPEMFKSKQSLTTNAKDLSYALFKYPDYRIEAEYPIKIMIDIVLQKFDFQLRKHHIIYNKEKDNYIVVDGADKKSHVDYNESRRMSIVVNIIAKEGKNK